MSETLRVEMRREGEVGILETDGYINHLDAEGVVEVCERLIRDGVRSVVLNLGKSRIVNSVGISILIEVIEKVKKQGGKVAFCCVPPTIAKTFRIMGLLRVAELHDTEAEAVQALGGV